MHGGTLKQSQFWITSSRLWMLIFLPQLRTNVSLFESVICLVPGELRYFLEARMIYDINTLKINCGFNPLKLIKATKGSYVLY